MSYVSDLDHRKIEATIFPDCVVEVHHVSDIARGLRKVPTTKIWLTERVLGRGTYGEVHLQMQNGEPESKRAVKVISTRERMSDLECKRELTALLEFSKPKYKDEEVFVHFYGWFQSDNAMYIAMEYIPLGDLESNLREIEKSNRTGCGLSGEEVKDIVTHILEGINIMHMEGFAHRDLKPQNVLVVQRKPKWWVKLADFGLSKRRTEESALRSQAGTQSYMAPEMFHYVLGLNSESSEYTSVVDIWALGCIMYRILTGKPPFLDLWSLQKYCSSAHQLVPPFKSMTADVRLADDFVRLLLTAHPDARPSASLALKHPWLSTNEKPGALNAAEVNDQSRYSGIANKLSRYPFTEAGTIPQAVGDKSSQINYNTASHAGLHSHYQKPMEVKQNAIVRPVEWPVADRQRMREPMPGAFEVEAFDSLGLSKRPRSISKNKLEPGSRISQTDGETDSSDEDWDTEKARAFPGSVERSERGADGTENWPVRVHNRSKLFEGSSGFQNQYRKIEPAREPQKPSVIARLWRHFMYPDKQIAQLDKQIGRPGKQVVRPGKQSVRPDMQIERPERHIERPDMQIERPERHIERLEGHIERPERPIERPDVQIKRLVEQIVRLDKQIERPGKQIERPNASPVAPLPPLFNIIFHTFTGYRISLPVNPKDTIRQVKYILSSTEGISTEGLAPQGLRLNFNGELLQDDSTVEECGIEEGSRIDLRWINAR